MRKFQCLLFALKSSYICCIICMTVPLTNKFEILRDIVQDKLDILLISETKVDPFFPKPIRDRRFQLSIRLDISSSKGGIMLFAREETPSKVLSAYKPNSSVENVFIKMNLRSKKWLLSCSCNPNLTLLNNHIQNISRGIDVYSSKYDNFIVLGDFNAETSNTTISEFWTTWHLSCLSGFLKCSQA